MEREIKFRAWDKEQKKMSEGMPLDWFIHGNDADMEFLETDENLPLSDLRQYLPDFIFTQFTGLLDKEGKEIYEGDGLDIETKKGIFRGFVKWNVQSAGFIVINKDRYLEIVSCAASSDSNATMKLDAATIIGNIFQNPELIKE